jgi:hypothetical protein
MAGKMTACVVGLVCSTMLFSAVENAGAASITVGAYRNARDDERVLMQMYLDGIHNGLLMYGVLLKIQRNEEPLYCPPGKLAITEEQAEDIMLRWVRAQSENQDKTLVSLALLLGLEETFPCSK